jgi:putative transposase
VALKLIYVTLSRLVSWIVLRTCFGTPARKCLDHLLITAPRHLAAVPQEYNAHYNTRRPHRALSQHPPTGRTPPSSGATARPPRRARLGGLVHEYVHLA